MTEDCLRAHDLWILARDTLLQAFLSTLLSLILGIIAGFWMGPARRSGLQWLDVFWAIPTTVAASAWHRFLGRQGPLCRSYPYGWGAVILAQVFYNAPLVAAHTRDASARMEASSLKASVELSGILGASSSWRFIHLKLPALLGLSVGIYQQIWIQCVTSYSLVLLLGGGPPVQTLETEFAGWLQSAPKPASAWILAACGGALVTLPVFCLQWWSFQRARVQSLAPESWERSTQNDRSRESNAQATRAPLAAFMTAALFFLPYFWLFDGTSMFASGGEWHDPEIWESVRYSLRLAAFTTVLTGGCSLGLTYAAWRFPRHLGVRAGIWSLGMFPSLLPPVGVAVVFLGWRSGGGLLPLWVWHFWVTLPWTLRLHLSDPQIYTEEESTALSRVMGARPFVCWLVSVWPLWRKQMPRILFFIWTASLGETLGAHLFAGQPLTLSAQIFRRSNQHRFTEATFCSRILLLLCILPLVIEWGVSLTRWWLHSRLNPRAQSGK